jgi:hypothetical protein
LAKLRAGEKTPTERYYNAGDFELQEKNALFFILSIFSRRVRNERKARRVKAARRQIFLKNGGAKQKITLHRVSVE